MNLKFTEIATIVTASVGVFSLVNIVIYNYVIQPSITKQLKQYEAKLNEVERIKQERWNLKREACLKALDIGDALLSNYTYQNAPNAEIVKTPVTTEEVRKCFNQLACSCDSPEVIQVLKRILYEPVRPDVIVDLRNAVRRELGFGVVSVDNDRANAFVGRVVSDPTIKR